MSKDVAARLDALAHDYREGRLTLSSYRSLRAPLLDLLAAQPGVDGVDRPVPTQRGRARARMARHDSPSQDEQAVRRGSRLAVGVAAMATAVIAAVTLYPRFRDVLASAPAAPANVDAADETSQPLGDSEDWSSERMHSLLSEFDGRAVCRRELAGSATPFCRDLLATADAGPQLLVLTANSEKAASTHRLFAISLHEVSQAQFRRYCAHTGSRCRKQAWAQGDDAVVNVTTEEARQYLVWLSEMSGQTYRLPTNAEWQQAANAGKKFGWRAGPEREWSGRNGSDQTGPEDLRGFRVVRELR